MMRSALLLSSTMSNVGVGVELEFGSWNPGSWCWDLAVCKLESA